MEVKTITLRTGLVIEQTITKEKTSIQVVNLPTDANGNKIYPRIKRVAA